MIKNVAKVSHKASLKILIGFFIFVIFLLGKTNSAMAATPAFVQVNAKEVISSTTNRLTFKKANIAGNTIVVYVAWTNTGTTTITDNRGNVYQSAGSAVRWNGGAWSSQIFYANNIAAGTSTVTAAFSQAISGFADLYIHEYSGLDPVSPLDKTVSAFGTSSAMNSGSATTTNASELIFGGGASRGTVTKGTRFTARSRGYGNLTEDRFVTTTGSYAATATQNSNGWVLQMAAFKAAPMDTTTPSVPTALVATSSSMTQINLSWDAATDPDNASAQISYAIYRNGIKIATTSAGILTYQNTGLTLNTSYFYNVAAVDPAGNVSNLSATATARTLADTSAPSAPTGVTATAISGTQINVSWAPSTDNVGVVGYQIFQNGILIASTTALSYSGTQLTPEGTYTYTIAACDAAGNVSLQSLPATVTTPILDTIAPSVPFDLSVTGISYSQINLTWSTSTDNVAVIGYKIYRDGLQVGTSAANSFADSGLIASTIYAYAVSAFDAAGNVSASSILIATSTTVGSPPIVNDVGFPKNVSRLNVSGATMVSPTFTTGGSVRTLVAVVSWYTPAEDPYPATLAWVGGTPAGATAWVKQVEPVDGTIHWTSQIWTATATNVLTNASVIATRNYPRSELSTGILSIYSLANASTTFGGSAEHHSPMSDVGRNISGIYDVTVPVIAANSWIIGISQGGDTYVPFTARANTTIDYQANDGGADGGAAAWHLTTPTTGAGNYTVGVTDSDLAFSVEGLEILQQ
ncbi:MAG: hypothetical protein WC725_01770 [Patescibacteria group bacterium]|jgi:chitodextrinase